MSYLLDTVVLSALRRRKRDANVVAWIESVASSELYLSTVTIGEIELGIARRRVADPAFAMELEDWLDVTLRAFGDRILALDVRIARRWGRLAARIGNQGLDLAIAATALEHGLTVVTRNVAHIAPTEVPVFDPFAPRRRPARSERRRRPAFSR